ncbi:hypothetical protein RvY_13530, partial [Ramazzottius varieornatus]
MYGLEICRNGDTGERDGKGCYPLRGPIPGVDWEGTGLSLAWVKVEGSITPLSDRMRTLGDGR